MNVKPAKHDALGCVWRSRKWILTAAAPLIKLGVCLTKAALKDAK
jgi:hypothetical protein